MPSKSESLTKVGIYFNISSIISHSCCVHMRSVFLVQQLLKLQLSLSCCVSKTLIHVFITSYLVYYNGILSCLLSKAWDRLQYVQNSAAWALTCMTSWQHIIPTLVHFTGSQLGLKSHTKLSSPINPAGSCPFLLLFQKYQQSRVFSSSPKLDCGLLVVEPVKNNMLNI